MANSVLDIIINAVDKTKAAFNSVEANGKSSMGAVTAASNTASKAMDSVGTASGGMGKSMGAANVNATMLRQNLIMVSQAAVDASRGMQQFADQNRETSVSIEKLSIISGLQEDQLKSSIKSLVDGGNSVADVTLNFKQAAEQGAKTTTQMENFTVAVDKLSAASGGNRVAFGESISGLRSLGIGVDNVNEAYSAYGFLLKNNVTDITEFNNTIGRKGDVLAKYGVGMNESAAIVGLYTNKIGNSKKAIVEFSQALDKSGGNLALVRQELGISADEYQNAVGAMDTGVFDEFINKLDTADGRMDTTMNKLSNWFGAVTLEHAGAISTLGSTIEVLGNVGMAVLALQAIMSSGAVVGAISGITAAIGGLSLASVAGFLAIAAIVVAVVAVIYFAFKALYAYIKDNWDAIAKFFTNSWESLKAGFKSFTDFILQASIMMVQTLFWPITSNVKLVLAAIDTVKKAYASITGMFSGDENEIGINVTGNKTANAPATPTTSANINNNITTTVELDGRAVGKSVAQTTNRLGGKTK